MNGGHLITSYKSASESTEEDFLTQHFSPSVLLKWDSNTLSKTMQECTKEKQQLLNGIKDYLSNNDNSPVNLNISELCLLLLPTKCAVEISMPISSDILNTHAFVFFTIATNDLNNYVSFDKISLANLFTIANNQYHVEVNDMILERLMSFYCPSKEKSFCKTQ